jgi:hypothetical protein
MHDPERAPLVGRAFEEYATGRFTKQEILQNVTTWGLRTRRGVPLNPQTIERSIDIDMYDRHSEKLRQEVTLLRMERHASEIEELDVRRHPGVRRAPPAARRRPLGAVVTRPAPAVPTAVLP